MAPQRRQDWWKTVWKNAYPYARAGLHGALKLRNTLQNSSAGKKQTRNKYRDKGPSTVTRQHDLRRQYKRKPEGKARKRLRKFAKKIKKAQQLNLPLCSVGEWNNVVNILSTAALGNPSTQYILDTAALTSRVDYRLMGNSSNGMANFMTQLNANVINETATLARRVTEYANWELFGNCVMQLAFKNQQTPAILVDVYECLAACDIPTGDPRATAVGAWTNCLTDMEQLVNVSTSQPRMIPANTGTTPFEAANFAKSWKILNKSRIEMQSGELVSMQFMTKNRMIKYAKWEGIACKKGITKDFIVIACPSYGSDLAVGEILRVEWTKHYHFRVPDAGTTGVQETYNYAVSY